MLDGIHGHTNNEAGFITEEFALEGTELFNALAKKQTHALS